MWNRNCSYNMTTDQQVTCNWGTYQQRTLQGALPMVCRSASSATVLQLPLSYAVTPFCVIVFYLCYMKAAHKMLYLHSTATGTVIKNQVRGPTYYISKYLLIYQITLVHFSCNGHRKLCSSFVNLISATQGGKNKPNKQLSKTLGLYLTKPTLKGLLRNIQEILISQSLTITPVRHSPFMQCFVGSFPNNLLAQRTSPFLETCRMAMSEIKCQTLTRSIENIK